MRRDTVVVAPPLKKHCCWAEHPYRALKGTIRRCSCGRYFSYEGLTSSGNPKWEPISRREARSRIRAAVAGSSETGNPT
jgi:hypothetical protein